MTKFHGKSSSLLRNLNSLERQPVILELMASADFGEQKSKENIILLSSIFLTFLVMNNLWGFLLKQCAYEKNDFTDCFHVLYNHTELSRGRN